MSGLEKAEPYYQKRAKALVDIIFDAKMFNPELERDGIQAIEDYVAFEFQSQCQNAVRAHELLKKAKDLMAK